MAYTSVKLTAESNSFKSQMKSAATEVKVLAAEFKTAEAKAKAFGSTSDVLKAKAEGLTAKISAQKNIVKLNSEQQEKLTQKLVEQKSKQEELRTKLESARSAYEKTAQQTGKNSEQSKKLKEELSKLEEEYKTNSSAIEKTENALTKQTVATEKSKTSLYNMEAELKKVNEQLKDNKLEKFATACDTAGTKMESFGKKMSVVSAGIVGIGAESIKAFTELDEGYDTIVTKTGATGEALDGLTKSADNVFGTMPEDMSTVGEAIGEVNTRFHTTGKELEKTSKQFVQFATINGTKVTQSVDQVDKIMKAWNVDASQTGNLLGLLTAKAQETGISVDTLEGYVLSNNAQFKEMGLSLPQAINLMAQFDENGVDSTQAMAGLKKALQNATSEGKSMDEALSDTIGSIKNAKTETEAMQVATELFGKKGAAEMAKAIRENRINLTGLSSSMEEYGSVVENTYNGTLDPIDNAKVAMNNAKMALSALATTAQTSATPMIEKLTGNIQELTQWFTSLSPAQQETVLKVGLVVAAIGPLSVGFGKVAQGISETVTTGQKFVSGAAKIIAKITAKTAATTASAAAETAATSVTTAQTVATTAQTAATTAATGATTALGVAMKILGTVGVVGIIAGIVTAIVLLVKNWDKVTETVKKMGAAVKQGWHDMKESVATKTSEMKQSVSEGWEHMKQSASTKTAEWKENVSQKMSQMKQDVSSKTEELKNKWSSDFTNIKDRAGNLMEVTRAITAQKLAEMKSSYDAAGGGIKGVVAAYSTGVKSTMETALTAMNIITGGKLENIRGAFSDKLAGAKNIAASTMNGVKDALAWKMEEARATVAASIDRIRGAFNFSWSLPHLKLPHISVWGGKSPFGIGGKGSLPSFDIQWYKAGAIMTKPTIFGVNGDKWLGGGEAGDEAILPLTPFYREFNSILDRKLQAVNTYVTNNIVVHTYIDSNEVANITTDKVSEHLAIDRKKRR